jgi:hypothetical protein
MLAGPAFAAGTQSFSGFHFRPASPADAGCFSRYNYGGLRNDCSTARTVIATVPHMGSGWYSTSVTVLGNNTWCRSLSIGDKGDYANGSTSPAWTISGPMTWQNLNMSLVGIFNNTNQSILVECGLQSGGVIGSVSVSW